ncbi:hypothetical protein [Nonomuraea jiangxiensis]|uniref:Uncharacterized protein n=1 Tax=Nonomuraea jiangxiensis TaxID=633440 RepID=A0A1G9VX14_9ACTN|nr:hypothetical protein [Nonomuraea jiangxiensis]SDM76643.1 hypothetical protein SAMN05421869_1555 [Nonomuraea jiangxiensis]
MFDDDLSRTLKAVARTAQPSDLLTGVARLRRRRRRRTGAVLAAAAVAVVVAVVTVLVRPVTSAPMPATTPTPTSTDLAGMVTSATVRLPARSPDGLEYQPVAAIDARRLLLLTRRGFDMFDAVTREITPVAELGGRGEVRQVRADNRHVVWLTAVEPSPAELRTPGHEMIPDVPPELLHTYEYWTVPLSGGAPTRLPPTSPGLAFEVAGDDMVLVDGSGDVSRVPLTGGPPRAVAGGKNAVALDWPWAILATERALTGGEPVEALNVETGEKRQLAASLCASGRCLLSPLRHCSADWCLGSDARGNPAAMRTNGSQTLPLPAEGAEPPALNRFAVLDDGRCLFDLATGVSLTLPRDIPAQSYGDGGRTLLVSSAGDDVIQVLNLKAIT